MSEKRPLISVCIPSYHSSIDLIRRCLDSVAVQQLTEEVETIVLFDGMEDDHLQIMERLSGLYPETHFEISEHVGVSGARNQLIEHSQGSWLVFLDADDCLAEDALARYEDAIYGDDADIVVANHYRKYASKRIEVACFNDEVIWKEGGVLDYLKYVLSPASDQGVVWGKAFKRDFVISNKLTFNDFLSNGEDQEFMVRAALAANSIKAIPFCTYEYSYNPESSVRKFSQDYPEQIEATITSVSRCLRMHENPLIDRGIFYQFVLDRLLLIIINYINHPEFPGGFLARKTTYNSIVRSPEFAEAIQEGDTGCFSPARRFVLECARRRLFFPVRLVGWVRHRQLARNNRREGD